MNRPYGTSNQPRQQGRAEHTRLGVHRLAEVLGLYKGVVTAHAVDLGGDEFGVEVGAAGDFVGVDNFYNFDPSWDGSEMVIAKGRSSVKIVMIENLFK